MKAGDKDTGDHDDDARDAPTELKFPIHKLIVLYLHCILQKSDYFSRIIAVGDIAQLVRARH